MSVDRAVAIQHVRTGVLNDREYSGWRPGETAIVVTHRFEIGDGLATVMPLHATIDLITAVGDDRTYLVTTRGYTVEKLLDIAMAYANGLLDEVELLIQALRPQEYPLL